MYFFLKRGNVWCPESSPGSLSNCTSVNSNSCKWPNHKAYVEPSPGKGQYECLQS